jgi:hypothetical protein
MSSSIFLKSVTRKSEQLRRISGTLATVISQMENRTDLVQFDSQYPTVLLGSIEDPKEARKLIYRAVERLNFPDKF